MAFASLLSPDPKTPLIRRHLCTYKVAGRDLPLVPSHPRATH